LKQLNDGFDNLGLLISVGCLGVSFKMHHDRDSESSISNPVVCSVVSSTNDVIGPNVLDDLDLNIFTAGSVVASSGDIGNNAAAVIAATFSFYLIYWLRFWLGFWLGFWFGV